MARISVLGAGSWGIALAVMLNKNGHEVKVWSHRQSQVDQMNDTHTSDKIKGVKLPESMLFTADIEDAAKTADVVLMAVPSKATRETAEKIKDYVNSNQIFITVTKGIEEETLFTQTEILEDVLGQDKKICVLSGPSHAEEVVVFKPTLVVAGSTDRQTALFVQNLFMNKYFRVYSSPDVKGIEVGAALKNVIALAAGMSDGLGFGDNAKAALDKLGQNAVVDVKGYADEVGPEKFNQTLSEKRAKTVADYLEGRGLKVNTTTGYGETGDVVARVVVVSPAK